MSRSVLFVGMILSLALGCGSNDRTSNTVTIDAAVSNDGKLPSDASDFQFVTMRGTVWAPGNAPGMVPPGHEIPVFNALVYLTPNRPDPIPTQVFCEKCTEAPVSGVTTDHKGKFTLTAQLGETYWLVIQKGQFRLERQITIDPAFANMPAMFTTLPSENNPEQGMTIPRMALASGSFDKMEDILGKMGMGEVDSDGNLIAASAAGKFDIYSNGGAVDGVAIGTFTSLVTDLDKMKQYHIIFVPCGGSSNTMALKDPQVLKNIRDYVDAGGRWYVVDWSGEWSDNVFPEQVELVGQSDDTPAGAWDPLAETWNTGSFGKADGSPSYEATSQASDLDMAMWMQGQLGPTAHGAIAELDPTNFTVADNWNRIKKMHDVLVTNERGEEIWDRPRAYVIGQEAGAPTRTLMSTFEPVGCGRVLYGTFHSTPEDHVGLVPQERVLLYLVLEIGVCKEDIGIDP